MIKLVLSEREIFMLSVILPICFPFYGASYGILGVIVGALCQVVFGYTVIQLWRPKL